MQLLDRSNFVIVCKQSCAGNQMPPHRISMRLAPNLKSGNMLGSTDGLLVH